MGDSDPRSRENEEVHDVGVCAFRNVCVLEVSRVHLLFLSSVLVFFIVSSERLFEFIFTLKVIGEDLKVL